MPKTASTTKSSSVSLVIPKVKLGEILIRFLQFFVVWKSLNRTLFQNILTFWITSVIAKFVVVTKNIFHLNVIKYESTTKLSLLCMWCVLSILFSFENCTQLSITLDLPLLWHFPTILPTTILQFL